MDDPTEAAAKIQAEQEHAEKAQRKQNKAALTIRPAL
jgi:hypothetical protein